MKTDTQSPRQARQLASIAEHSTNIQHVAGKANVVADALSRLEFKPSTGAADRSDKIVTEGASHSVQLQNQAPESIDDDAVQPLVCYAIAQGVDYEALAQAQMESEDVQL